MRNLLITFILLSPVFSEAQRHPEGAPGPEGAPPDPVTDAATGGGPDVGIADTEITDTEIPDTEITNTEITDTGVATSDHLAAAPKPAPRQPGEDPHAAQPPQPSKDSEGDEDKPCQHKAVNLRPGEFSLSAYDSQDRLLLIRPVQPRLPQGPDRPLPIQLKSEDGGFRLPLEPAAVDDAMDAHQNGQLWVSLRVQTAAPAHAGGEPAQGHCEVDVDSVHSRLVVHQRTESGALERDLPPAQIVTRVATGKVRVGRMQVDAGQGLEKAARLSMALTAVSQRCMEQALRSRPVVNGSLHLQLERSPAGQMRPPQVVIDGLACPFVSECLTHGLEEPEISTQLRQAVPEGTRVFVPLFFKGAVQEHTITP